MRCGVVKVLYGSFGGTVSPCPYSIYQHERSGQAWLVTVPPFFVWGYLLGYAVGYETEREKIPLRLWLYMMICNRSISAAFVFGKTWAYKSIVIARLLCPRMLFNVCGVPPCSINLVANVSRKA